MELESYFEGVVDKSIIPTIITESKEDKNVAAIDLIKAYNANRKLIPQNYRLEFSTNYKILVAKSPLAIAQDFIENKENLETVRLFNARQHLMRLDIYSRPMVKNKELSSAYIRSFNNHKFIGPYSLDEEFNERNQITYRIQGKNGKVYTLTREFAQKLIQTLEENGLPQTEYIVKAYFRSIANETSEEFLENLSMHTKILKKAIKK